MTPQTIINTARRIFQDMGTMPRQTDGELLGYVNEALKEAAVMRPDLFSTLGTFNCAAGAQQKLDFANAHQLLDVLATAAGVGLTPMDYVALDLFQPAWRAGTQGPAQQWARLEGDPLAFLVYPPSTAGQQLQTRYVRIPATYGLGDVITDLPDTFEPALADYVVYRTESKDDEHVLGQRAAAHYAAFKTKFGVSNATVSE